MRELEFPVLDIVPWCLFLVIVSTLLGLTRVVTDLRCDSYD